MSDADTFLARYPAATRAITQKLRRLILRGRPRAVEVLHASQNHFAYSFSGRAREQVIYLTPLADYVRLGFFWGGILPDPQGLLVGQGKRLHHLKVASLAEAGRPAVKALVSDAWADAQANRTPATAPGQKPKRA